MSTHPRRCLAREPSVRLVGLPGDVAARVTPVLRDGEDLRDFVLRAIEREVERRREREMRLEGVRAMIA